MLSKIEPQNLSNPNLNLNLRFRVGFGFYILKEVQV
jgi:hypothetical protein